MDVPFCFANDDQDWSSAIFLPIREEEKDEELLKRDTQFFDKVQLILRLDLFLFLDLAHDL